MTNQIDSLRNDSPPYEIEEFFFREKYSPLYTISKRLCGRKCFVISSLANLKILMNFILKLALKHFTLEK